MDIFGIGFMELAVVMLVGIIFLGPARIVELAGKMGSYWRQAQRILREAADAATVKLDAPLEHPANPPAPPVDAPDDAVARGRSGDAAAPEADANTEEAERHG